MSSTEEIAVLQQEDRLVADGAEDPVGDEAGDLLAEHDRLLAEPAGQVDDRLHGRLVRAEHLDAAHHQRRVEEVHVGDAVRAPGGVGELRRHDRRRVRGEDRVRRRELVEPGEDLPLDVQLLDGRLDHEVRGRRGGVEVRGEREPGEGVVDVVAGAAALGDVAVEPRTQGRLRAGQRVVGEVGDGRVVAGEGADHGDLRAHRAGADDEHSLHRHTPLNAGGRFSRNALAPSALSAVV